MYGAHQWLAEEEGARFMRGNEPRMPFNQSPFPKVTFNYVHSLPTH